VVTAGDAATSRRALLARLRATPAALAAALRGRANDALGRRPAERVWSSTEIVCHLRDVEELFQLRFQSILALDDPVILVLGAEAAQLAPWRIAGAIGHPLDPDRWAEDRQYRRHDAAVALSAFGRRRDGVLTLLKGLSDAQWSRHGVHLRRGALPLDAWVASLADHDDNHLDQLRRALDGRA
jgi:hypothetical protein